MTVAERGPPSIRATSPKYWPGPSVARLAFARDRGLSGGDNEKGGPSGALHDHGFALRETTFLEQAADLFRLPTVHTGEELDALKGGNSPFPNAKHQLNSFHATPRARASSIMKLGKQS